MLPKTREELSSISVAMKVWEDHTHGMMGRVPDYINRAMSGYAAGAAFLGEAGSALRRQCDPLPRSICVRTTCASRIR